MKKLNSRTFNSNVFEINQVVEYLDITLKHVGHLIGTFMNFEEDENGDIITDTALNLEALDELQFATKKISSKADILQNKVNELKNIVNIK